MSITTITDFPRKVKEIENQWIPMSDGTKLAARIWLPEDADDNPVPALLEYLPYRKRDGTIERDALTQPYFAGHGYAAVRVDMRGNGDSDGLMEDEYAKQEQDDALDVIDWLYLMPNGTVMNRSQMRKFGITMAELVATMRPAPPRPARPPRQADHQAENAFGDSMIGT